MHKISLPLSLLLACLLGATAAQAEIYRWIDSNGELQFGDRPPESLGAKSVELAPSNHYTHQDVKLPRIEHRKAASGGRVVMYSAQWCGICRQARRYFQSNQIAFQEYDVETSDKGRHDFQQLGGRGVPLILVNGQRMNGFSADRFEQLYQNKK